tara:strand:- start:164 stop:463 length:300 start_codon:yes stop_codon:yes gene_type:complete
MDPEDNRNSTLTVVALNDDANATSRVQLEAGLAPPNGVNTAEPPNTKDPYSKFQSLTDTPDTMSNALAADTGASNTAVNCNTLLCVVLPSEQLSVGTGR